MPQMDNICFHVAKLDACLLYDAYFPGGFHYSGYHASMETSRYN